MKREEKKERNKKRILDVAYEQMLHRGIRGTSIRSICVTSGISSVSLYKYFPSKESIAEQVALRFYKNNMTDVIKIAEDTNFTFQEKLKAFEQKNRTLHTALAPEVLHDFLEMTENSETIKAYVNNMKYKISMLIIQAGRESGVINSTAKDSSIVLFANLMLDYTSVNEDQLDQGARQDLEQLFMYGVHGVSEDKGLDPKD